MRNHGNINHYTTRNNRSRGHDACRIRSLDRCRTAAFRRNKQIQTFGTVSEMHCLDRARSIRHIDHCGSRFRRYVRRPCGRKTDSVPEWTSCIALSIPFRSVLGGNRLCRRRCRVGSIREMKYVVRLRGVTCRRRRRASSSTRERSTVLVSYRYRYRCGRRGERQPWESLRGVQLGRDHTIS